MEKEANAVVHPKNNGVAPHDILAGQPPMEQPGDVTHLLQRMSSGDRNAEELLIPLVYAELHRLASNSLRSERPDHTLQATALVHEAYLCLCRQSSVGVHDRMHFFCLAARLMRRILIDYARQHKAVKRGDGALHVPLLDELAISRQQLTTAVIVDDLLTQLAEVSPRQAQVVEMRFFSGLTETEIASILNLTPRTVKRDWFMARAWLHQQMSQRETHE